MTDESDKWDSFLDAWQELKGKNDALVNWAEDALKSIKPKEKAHQLKTRLEDINGKD